MLAAAYFCRNYVLLNIVASKIAPKDLLSREAITSFLKKAVSFKSAVILEDGEEERAKLLSVVFKILITSKNTVVNWISFPYLS